MSVTTVSSSMITDATILNADIGAAAAIATTKLGAGAVVQVVNVQTGAVATGTTSTPYDDTIPQKTEGNEFMTLAITPTNASNKLVIEVSANVATTGGGTTIQWCIFQDTTANALSMISTRGNDVANRLQNATFRFYMAAGTTSETTFKVRIGTSGTTTVTLNGQSGDRKFGGSATSSITITEIKV